MNHHHLCKLAAVLLLSGAPAMAAAGIPVRATATLGAEEVILDVFVDSGGVPLRGFGFTVNFNPDELGFVSGGRYAGLWFLRGEDGVSHAYTDVTVPSAGSVRVVGGRFDGNHPGEGMAGDNLLLATLVFKRMTANMPTIMLDLAGPPPFVGFATADGQSLDGTVEIQEVVLQAASEDVDNDGLPDDFERDTFGDLTTSDGATDTDGDGDDDRSEWLRGTDATDPKSKFELQIIPQGDGTKLALWTGRLGRVYDLEWSPDLDGFHVIGPGVPGAVPQVEMPDEAHNNDPEGFYRVVTKFPTMGR